MNESDHKEREAAGLNVLKLVPHDKDWAGWYRAEAARLKEIPGILDVMHIGSTALPDVDAKPVVDIAARADGDPADSGLRARLESEGYSGHGEYGLPGRQFFTKGSPARFHLHVVGPDAAHWADWRDFRDYLLACPEARDAYREEKYRVAESVEWDRQEYTRGKSAFIARILRQAREEQDGKEEASSK